MERKLSIKKYDRVARDCAGETRAVVNGHIQLTAMPISIVMKVIGATTAWLSLVYQLSHSSKFWRAAPVDASVWLPALYDASASSQQAELDAGLLASAFLFLCYRSDFRKAFRFVLSKIYDATQLQAQEPFSAMLVKHEKCAVSIHNSFPTSKSSST